MKKEDKNEIKKMVIILIYLFIICICLTWGGFHVYHIGLINEAQLGYLGAIIGGGMTLLGVIFTINHTNAIREIDRKERDLERKEELAIQYKPIITAEVVETSEIMGGIIKSKICIKNVGRGEANDLKFSIDQLNGNDYSLYPTTLSNDIYPVLQDNKYEFIFCKIDKTKPYSSNKMSGILPLEKKVYYFKSEISYKNPIDSKYLYILNMKLSLMKVVPKEEIPNIASINQKEPPPEIWELGIDTAEYSTFIVDKSATKDQEE